MKKDVYIIGGIFALVIAGFLLGFKYFAKPAPPPADATSSSSDLVKADPSVLMGDGSPSKGPTMAKVVLVEYLDPECEACRAFHPYLKKILAEFDGKIRYLVRFMPYHSNSKVAIRALYAAEEQGKVWEYLDYLFENQNQWGHKPDEQSKLMLEYAKTLGLDQKKFKDDFESPKSTAMVEQDKKDGEASGVMGTPSFYINGTQLSELGEAPLRQAIVSALGTE